LQYRWMIFVCFVPCICHEKPRAVRVIPPCPSSPNGIKSVKNWKS
jgi:hypothetical protein